MFLILVRIFNWRTVKGVCRNLVEELFQDFAEELDILVWDLLFVLEAELCLVYV